MVQRFSNPRPTVIVNPVSGRGKTYKNWEKIKDFLIYKFKEIRTRFTEAPKHALEIAREEIKNGVEHLISVGGDGTLNEVVNGFLENDSPINPGAAISVLPSGRGNDFAKTLKIKIPRLKFNKRLQLDAVKIGGKYFINVLDMGLGGEIVSRLSEGTHSGITYTFALLKEFFKYRPKEYLINVDGEEIKGKFLTVIVANGTTFGGGMKVAPKASPSDGILDVITVGDFSPVEFMFNLWRLYTGKLLSHPKVNHKRGISVKIESEEQYGEYDGELFKASVVEARVLKEAVGFII